MRQLLIILSSVLLITLISTESLAQVDTSNNIVVKHWTLVKDAHQKYLKATINFCSLNQVKSKQPKTAKELSDKSNAFLNFLSSTTTIDSSFAAKVDSLNFSLLSFFVIFFDEIQKDKALFNHPRIRQEGKKVENEIQNTGRQIHDFNYWIYEKNNIKIKFKDTNF